LLTHVAGGVACPTEFKEPTGAAMSAADTEAECCVNIQPYGHGQAARKGFGANLLINEHRGFRPLLEFAPGATLRYPYYFIITAVRSLEEWFAHGR
jgi:hypothetical protein